MNIVVGAPLVIRLLSNDGVDEVLRQTMKPPRVLHAPHLIDAEVFSGIRGLLLGRKLGTERAEQMREDFAAMRIERHPMTVMGPRILSLRHNLTAYDACYIVLAEALNCPLYTADEKFAGSTGHTVSIRVAHRTG